MRPVSLLTLFGLAFVAGSATAAAKPNIVVIVADDLGFSDLGCYGSEVPTPSLDGLAVAGLRFTQFYNCARCCPTRAALLTGLYPHQAGVGHMLGNWKLPHYSTGLQANCVTIAEALKPAGYRCYHVGKWHVGGVGRRAAGDIDNHPLGRGFDRAYGTGGGGNYFAPNPLYLDRQPVKPEGDYYITDALSEYAARFIGEHSRDHAGTPFFLHLCYTAPHFPLHARPEDIAKYRGKYRDGWDVLRDRRLARQKELGVVPKDAQLSPRHPDAVPWASLSEKERDEWDLRMAVYAAMIDRMDRGIGQVLTALKAIGQEDNTLVVFFSDNGASAEFLDSWPNPARGHKPGSVVGSKESHKCLEVGWANAANTPFREHKMWVHEGGISTPFIARWPAGITAAHGSLAPAVGHVIDLMPTCLELAGATYPQRARDMDLTPPEGRNLAPALRGEALPERTLAWEHEGNRAIRVGSWKLVAAYRKPWELFDLAADRSECHNLAGEQPDRVRELAAAWQRWADRVGVLPWEQLPGASYKPSAGYRKTSERP
ncbi:MAG TPA: arylsulfatase [Gemmataceae bacterium]|jgi:arylsulfatase